MEISSQSRATKSLPTKKLFAAFVIMSWSVIVIVSVLLNKTQAIDGEIFFQMHMYSKYKELKNDTSVSLLNNSFVSLLDNNVYIYSAIAYNKTKQSVYDTIYLSGWENSQRLLRLNITTFLCCLVNEHRKREVVTTRLLEKRNWSTTEKAKLEVKHFACPNGHNFTAEAVTLSPDTHCPKSYSKYINIHYPQRLTGDKLAVCAKIVYGNISASSIIEWFEYHKLMGVSKVMVYTYRLNPAAMSVLEYYKSVGLCEHFPFTLPPIDGVERSVGIKNFQGWSDEQVPVYDCQWRLSGYTYLALIDIDEYIHPSSDNNLLKLLKTMRLYYPRAAGFVLKTEFFAKTWGQDNGTDTVPGLTIGIYTMRTEENKDREKCIVMPGRIVPGRMYTHGFSANKPYNKQQVEAGVIVLKHYRDCRKEWLKKDGEMCYKTIKRVRDTSMMPYAKMIKHNVSEIKTILGIT